MANLEKAATTVLGWLNPDKTTGKTLMILNALGIGFAAASNTFAAAVDKNTSAEDKKFLVPAGAVTGLANLGIYFGMTKKIIDALAGREVSIEEKAKLSLAEQKKLGGFAGKIIDKMVDDKTYLDRATAFVDNKLLKASKTIKDPKLLESMKTSLKDSNGEITGYAKRMFGSNIRNGLGVIGAFVGAVVGCAIITPILRDVSAYAVQKWREKRNPELQSKPYSPYFDPSHIGPKYAKINKQPLSMTSYMNFTHGRTRV